MERELDNCKEGLQIPTYYAICYQARPIPDIVIYVHGFVDPYWDGDIDHRRSTSRYVVNLF